MRAAEDFLSAKVSKQIASIVCDSLGQWRKIAGLQNACHSTISPVLACDLRAIYYQRGELDD